MGLMPPTRKGWWEAYRNNIVRHSAQTLDMSAQQIQRETTRGHGVHTHTQVHMHTYMHAHAHIHTYTLTEVETRVY